MSPTGDRPERGGPEAARRKALLGLLGLAARAGDLVAGTEAVRRGVREGKVRRVLLAVDASAGQQRKLLPLLEARGVPHDYAATQAELGGAIGRNPVSAVGLVSAGFAGRAGELARGLSARPARTRGVSQRD